MGMTTTNDTGPLWDPHGGRAPRGARPPARYFRSHSGVAVQVLRTSMRNARGERLYRLHYLESPELTGNQLWTLDELSMQVARWLKSRPRFAKVRR